MRWELGSFWVCPTAPMTSAGTPLYITYVMHSGDKWTSSTYTSALHCPYRAGIVPPICLGRALPYQAFPSRRKYSRISNNISKCKIAYKIAISKQASRARTHHQRSSGRCFATRPFTSKAQHDQCVMNTDSARRKHSLMPWKTSVTWLMKVWHLHSIHLF